MSSGTLQTLSAVSQGRGLLQYPLTLHIIGGDDGGANEPQVPAVKQTHSWCGKCALFLLIRGSCGQDFAACLGILGPVLGSLHMELNGGAAFTSESLRSLWTCSNLRSLTLESFKIELKAEDLEAGLQHLRSAAITPLTFSNQQYLQCRCQHVLHWSSAADNLHVCVPGSWRT